MNILTLILQASIVEQIILIILLLISIASWGMIVQRVWVINRAQHIFNDFEFAFWSGKDLNKLYMTYRPTLSSNSGIHNVFCSGFHEFRRLNAQTDVEVLIVSIQRVMRIAIAKEQDHLNRHLTTLASFGSLAPYIGLLGTVLGVVSAFLGLAQSGAATTTLASVAPGIAEALIATAMGLIAAIPAVWAYNNFSSRVNTLLDGYETFTDEFASILNRKIRQRIVVPTQKPQSFQRPVAQEATPQHFSSETARMQATSQFQKPHHP